MRFAPRLLLTLLSVALVLFPASADARGLLRKRCRQECCAPAPKSAHYMVVAPAPVVHTCPPANVVLEFDIGSCRGEGGDCGLTAAGVATCNAAGSKPSKVYMVVNRSCPSCAAGNTTCASAPSRPWMEPADSVIWNPLSNTASITFNSVDDVNSTRIVTCNEQHSVCFVVCYEDGSCNRVSYTYRPDTECTFLCPDCVYTQGGIGLREGQPAPAAPAKP